MKIKDFQNKVAVVTGGSSGIGLATARALAARGANVWLMARDETKLSQALKDVQAVGVNPDQRFGVVSTDVADSEEVQAAVAQVTSQVGLPDIVINSAGVAHPGYFEQLDLEIFRWMMDVNYFGCVHVAKAILPGMIERGSGYLVNISSIAGFLGVFGYTAYGASKYALRGFSEILRAEMKPKGIGVSIVYPPDVDTPQLEYEEQFKPLETKALAGNAGLMSPSVVAEEIIKGIEKGRFLILPGTESKILYRLNGLLGRSVFSLMDLLIAQSQNVKDR